MNNSQFQTIELKNEGAVWLLTINRPQAMNALNSLVLTELAEALEFLSLRNFADCRCVVLTGAGEKSFVAGADIKELTSLDPISGKKFAEGGQRLFRRFENLQVPVIAAVNGFCLGGGLELALACDFIIASVNAKLGLPEVTLGLIPGFGGTVRLARRVGMARAKEMVFTGDFISASKALEVGLVNEVVSLPELLPTALKLANTIASRGSLAVQRAKASIMSAYDQAIDEAMLTEAQHFSHLFSTHDFKEGTAAFVEKRNPLFKGQ